MHYSSKTQTTWKKRKAQLIFLIVMSFGIIVYVIFHFAFGHKLGIQLREVKQQSMPADQSHHLFVYISLLVSLIVLIAVVTYLFKEISLHVNEQSEESHGDERNCGHAKNINARKTQKFTSTEDNAQQVLPKYFEKSEDIGNPDSGTSTAMFKKYGMVYAAEAEKKFADTILAIQEQERRNIGQELHDNVNQILAGAMITLDTVKDIGADTEKTLKFTNAAKSYILQAINEIRRLSHELSPATFDDNENAFENLLHSINVHNRYIIKTRVDAKLKQLISDEVFTNLFRILQEQLKNIVTYADARQIELSVTCTGSHVEMRIADDGKGFDTRQKKNGIGISNMRRRAATLGGNLFINTQPGKGCELVVDIPLS